MIGGHHMTFLLDGSFVPARTPGVNAVDADGEAVLVDEVTDHLHLLNGSAALLWACFDGESSVADVAFDLADELGVPYAQILTDILSVVHGLHEQGLLYDGRAAPPARPAAEPVDQALAVPRPRRLLEEPPSG